jgi:hypothetical protein
VLGLSMIRLGIDNIPNTLSLVGADGSINYGNVTQFSAADYAFNISYARKYKYLTVGGNLKIIRRIIGSFDNAWGFGGDFAIKYKKGNWIFGAMGRDITTTFNAWTATLSDYEKNVFAAQNNEIPKSAVELTYPKITLAAAYKAKLSNNFQLMGEIDADFTTDGQRNVLVSSSSFNIEPKMGIEAKYMNFLWLRLGVGNFQFVKNDIDITKKDLSYQPNLGLGLKLGNFSIDYALTNIGNVSQVLYSNIFSVKLDFKKKR